MDTNETDIATASCDPKTDIVGNPLYRKALRGLAKRVSGYLCKETKTTFEYTPDGEKRLKTETVTRKQIPPDFAAITFTLNCLAPHLWNSRRAEEPAESPGSPVDLSGLSEEALREIAGLSDD